MSNPEKVEKEYMDSISDHVDKLQTRIEFLEKKLREVTGFYGSKRNWVDSDHDNSYTKIQYDDKIIEQCGGDLARKIEKEVFSD